MSTHEDWPEWRERQREAAIEEAKEALGIRTMLNVFFKCTCGEEWTMHWSCACDDECPACGTIMTPYDDEEAA